MTNIIHNIRSSVAKIATTPIYVDWFVNPPKSKWRMKGGFPITWMIFSAVMLNLQFVGIYCGTGWRHVIPLHVQQYTHNKYLEWFLIPPRKPPDPTRTVKLSFEEIDDCGSTNPQNTKYLINKLHFVSLCYQIHLATRFHWKKIIESKSEVRTQNSSV